MSEHTGIEWTDATWNPTTGCTKVSPACAHCYIERTPPFRIKGRKFVNGHIPLEFNEDRLEQPLRWKKPRRIFVNSLSDLFHDDVANAFIDRVFAVMALCPQHTFQVLTKRADRMRAYLDRVNATAVNEYRDWPKLLDQQMPWLTDLIGADRMQALCEVPDVSSEWPLPNVWLGVSVENQHCADERIPLLLQTPAAVRFISAEPLLGPINLHASMFRCCRSEKCGESVFGLDWVIAGGESGPKARPSHPDWFRSLRNQCRAAGVAFHFKQWGEWAHGFSNLRRCIFLGEGEQRIPMTRLGKKAAGRRLDGREWNEFPAVRP